MPNAFASGTGSVTIQYRQYGSVHGQLQNVILDSNNTITMTMVVDDQVQGYSVRITAMWKGVRNGQSLSGAIQDFMGTVGEADFIGQGNWTGTLTSSLAGSGSLTGIITITSSTYAQFPQGQTIPISGSWTAGFSNPAPESS